MPFLLTVGDTVEGFVRSRFVKRVEQRLLPVLLEDQRREGE